MSSRDERNPREDRKAVAGLARELAAIERMTAPELAEKYRQVFGEPSRVRDREKLRKRIAWRLQERLEGGLSPRALERIEQLAPLARVQWQRPATGTPEPGGIVLASATRDPRLPPVGTVLTRAYEGVDHEVTVLDLAFLYRGEHYRSLSQIARLITGTAWNGFLFFFGRTHQSRGSAEHRAPGPGSR